MENEKENKDKVQSPEMQFDTWDEEQFYSENIVPKLKEIADLCYSRKIPFLLHVHYSHDNENTVGIGTRSKCFGRDSTQTAKIGACSTILVNGIDGLGMMALVAIAMANDKK